jgi:hypothetical protein
MIKCNSNNNLNIEELMQKRKLKSNQINYWNKGKDKNREVDRRGKASCMFFTSDLAILFLRHGTAVQAMVDHPVVLIISFPSGSLIDRPETVPRKF